MVLRQKLYTLREETRELRLKKQTEILARKSRKRYPAKCKDGGETEQYRKCNTDRRAAIGNQLLWEYRKRNKTEKMK